jgi:hypothetical protein
MRSKATILWFLVSVALAAALLLQWKSKKQQELKLEQLQIQVEKGTTKEKESSARVQELEKEVRTLNAGLQASEYELNRARASQVASQASMAPGASAAPPGSRQPQTESGGGMGKVLANMMKDPEMRKAMEQQQKMGMDMIYSSLFKELQLSPDQEKKFREMLLQQQMDNVAQAGAMFGGEGADRTKVAKEIAEKNQKNQEQIKELLGDEKYAQFQDYNLTLPERMMLDQLGKQTDISPEQNQQLLAIFKEEKKNVQINRGTPAADPTKDWQQLLQTGEAAEQMFAQQEEANNRVLERAGQVLTPEQLEKFGPLLKSQIDMQKAGMRMAREMFKSGNESQVAPPAP